MRACVRKILGERFRKVRRSSLSRELHTLDRPKATYMLRSLLALIALGSASAYTVGLPIMVTSRAPAPAMSAVTSFVAGTPTRAAGSITALACIAAAPLRAGTVAAVAVSLNMLRERQQAASVPPKEEVVVSWDPLIAFAESATAALATGAAAAATGVLDSMEDGK